MNTIFKANKNCQTPCNGGSVESYIIECLKKSTFTIDSIIEKEQQGVYNMSIEDLIIYIEHYYGSYLNKNVMIAVKKYIVATYNKDKYSDILKALMLHHKASQKTPCVASLRIAVNKAVSYKDIVKPTISKLENVQKNNYNKVDFSEETKINWDKLNEKLKITLVETPPETNKRTPTLFIPD